MIIIWSKKIEVFGIAIICVCERVGNWLDSIEKWKTNLS